ncbi:asparagine synthetase [hydrocarbon metagenome]|uniref:Asparagine synthetase n=1 Tax=hydrocarbon metagenome TaxID=938273 RepID=A0A0W8G4S4_9ZZZZ
MCGICGELRLDGRDVRETDILAMRDALRHRGPDDAGILIDGPLGLGHRRLSIIDLSPLGRQPMLSADGRFAIVFNGEIYNHRDIRRDLKSRGVIFRGGSDTEAAVNAAAVYGPGQAVSRFLGMFALALWDFREKTLHLCRDRVGVKPLYVCRAPGAWLFASEMRAFPARRDFVPDIDRAALFRHFRTGYFEGPDTVYHNVKKLPPGTLATIRADGSYTQTRYFDLSATVRGSYRGSYAQAGEELAELCRDAFALRLVSDVPVGMFLSGGVDSSLVSAVLRNDVGADVTHFTIGFAERHHDETAKAEALAKSLGVAHKVLRVTPDMARQAVLDFCEVYDEPFGDASGIPTAILSRFAREHVKVALSADGGDEQFCGYTGYRRYPGLYCALRPIPMLLRRALARGLRALPWERLADARLLGADRAALSPDRAARLGRFLDLLDIRDPRELAGLYAARGFPEQAAGRLLGMAPPPAVPFPPPEVPEPSDAAGLADWLMRRDFAFWLPEDILLKVDRASMAASLECRDPLLDHRIAELAFSLPMEFLIKGGQDKRLLRDLLRRRVPGELAGQPKQGFEIPLAAWLRGPHAPLVRDVLSRESLVRTGILDPDEAGRIRDRFFAGEGLHTQQVWLLVNFQMWAARWMGKQADRTGPEPAAGPRGTGGPA